MDVLRTVLAVCLLITLPVFYVGVYEQPRVVVCLGDSITEGMHGHARRENHPAQNTQSQYEYWAEKNLPRMTFVNRGVGGQTSAEMLARWSTDVIPEKPDYVLILAGTNDLHLNVPKATYKRNLELLCRYTYDDLNAQPILCTILPARGRRDVDEMNRIVQQVALAQHAPVIDFFACMNDQANPYHIRAGLHSDGVHPTVAGYRVMGEYLAHELRRLRFL
ncbi:MAG: SGNH/GDSL hydrolase family protein [Armatimonadota bacterium]